MTPTSITLYGTHWCPDCRRSRQFLSEHKIPYTFVDIEQDKAGEQVVLAANDGKRIIPTIVFGDGALLVEPSNAELAAKLGLKMQANGRDYDLIVVGGGPAGLLASIFTAREGINTLVVEKGALGGQAFLTGQLDNMPGFPEGISGYEFAARLRQQAERFGVELLQAQEVVDLQSQGGVHALATGDGSIYRSQSLLISTGSRYRRLGVSGENAYLGAGVHFCAACDGLFYTGQPVAVIGGGNSAADASLHLARYAERVELLVRGGELKASQVLRERLLSHPRINVRWHTEVQEFVGKKGRLRRLNLLNNRTNEAGEIAAAGAFVNVGMAPNTGFLHSSGVQMDSGRFIMTGYDLLASGQLPPGFAGRAPQFLETSVPGIFAAGDVRAGSVKQAPSAAGEGSSAAVMVKSYLHSL